uniref:Uncharacterized protein TCIL3000_11_10130 n=1 Tax=Trypanosoma congolense (strain IL3000) TaxID=1068625 RepID=G0V1M0_TRYCI|nr:unnamed protein product [Trypanosoma congolense IL3000]
MFSWLLGSSNAQEAPRSGISASSTNKTQRSLEDLELKVEMLGKREDVLGKKMDEELEKAKQFYANKNKQGALQCMKRKKMYEDQLTNIAAQKQNLEVLIFTLQNQTMSMEVLEAQRRAKDELKMANKKMDADRVDQTMDELTEEMEKANAVSEALRQPLDVHVADEDELMAELMDGLGGVQMSQPLKAKETEALDLPKMPSVPSGELPKRQQTADESDEEALRALERELLS